MSNRHKGCGGHVEGTSVTGWAQYRCRKCGAENLSDFQFEWIEDEMSEKKIVVPEGMLRTACQAYPNPRFDWVDSDNYGVFTRPVLEASLRWLSENPIVPSEDEIKKTFGDRPSTPIPALQQGFKEIQSRMFLAPEPLCRHCQNNPAGGFFDNTLCGPCYNSRENWELPEELWDLFWCFDFHGDAGNIHNRSILEAYRRGQRTPLAGKG